jgi:hypothetical protein
MAMNSSAPAILARARLPSNYGLAFEIRGTPATRCSRRVRVV